KNGGISAIETGKHAPVTCLLPFENGELWVGTGKGVLRWNGAELTRAGLPSALLDTAISSMIRDRDSNIWLGTTRGLLRFNAGGGSLDRNADPAARITAMFEDREGNLWIGRMGTIERLRDSAFVTYTMPGSGPQSAGAIYPGPDETIWYAPIAGGLRRLHD